MRAPCASAVDAVVVVVVGGGGDSCDHDSCNIRIVLEGSTQYSAIRHWDYIDAFGSGL